MVKALLVFCEQLALERKKMDTVDPASTTKKKRKRDKPTSDKTDVVISAKRNEAGDSVNAQAEFVPHDYVKANLTSLLQGTICQSTSLPSWK